MKRLSRLRPSPAMVVACIALTVALGGTSVCGDQACRRTASARSSSRRTPSRVVKVKANAITSPKVAGNSLTGADINEATWARCPRPRTPPRPAGRAGRCGRRGSRGTYPAPTRGGEDHTREFGAFPARSRRPRRSDPQRHRRVLPLTWESELYDTAGFFDPAAPDRLTAPIAGVYVINAGVRWGANALGTRFAGICINQPTRRRLRGREQRRRQSDRDERRSGYRHAEADPAVALDAAEAQCGRRRSGHRHPEQRCCAQRRRLPGDELGHDLGRKRLAAATSGS